jgi:hypothetical protein
MVPMLILRTHRLILQDPMLMDHCLRAKFHYLAILFHHIALDRLVLMLTTRGDLRRRTLRMWTRRTGLDTTLHVTLRLGHIPRP